MVSHSYANKYIWPQKSKRSYLCPYYSKVFAFTQWINTEYIDISLLLINTTKKEQKNTNFS